ncbi:hypothetical protein FRACYDRAFT_239044 [Fragilariopsis cylindrus CCMP1102]|uniref:FAD/NAD(P)-binding domain-containing protein n=1 Tax=Fragilariopsis cylindrus CCMP1102 TaxID=635003 RepID=A0A1E7FE47_9STRA|nr:hypothetical protein FRACYDRAFT_239044 [Fragilariopsis cylindrus CCMP1102]|eukprot:OEU16452.1 hypothetical protein FRACYDRAFT_239044 [Fragilariopsis cylindrus CCMP1102]
MIDRSITEKQDDFGARVAIVGAGFAGLVLANFLEKKEVGKTMEYCWNYKIFESKSSSIPIIGTIRSPNAKFVLEELDLLEEAYRDNNIFPDKKNCSSYNNKEEEEEVLLVNREPFLELLRRNVRKNIQSSCRVVDIRIIPCTITTTTATSGSQTQKYVLTDDEQTHGPFDLVVLANGLDFGGGKTHIMMMKNKASIRIGDCRWHQERRFKFDFGMTRIKQGADIAIQDGLQVGRKLEQYLHQVHQVVTDNKNNNNSDNDYVNDLSMDSILLSSSSNDDNNMYHKKFQMIILVVILPTIFALIIYHFLLQK